MFKRTLISLPLILSAQIFLAQDFTLAQVISRAKENSTTVAIARQSLETRQQLYNSSKNNYLPKVSLAGTYNHFGEKARLNLEEYRNDVLTKVPQNITTHANELNTALYGHPLPQGIQNHIYEVSQKILGDIYPDNNPEIGKKDYFFAGVLVRQPIYLGGKLRASQELSRQQLESGRINLENSEDLAAYTATLQYIQIMYFNSMIAVQQRLLESHRKNVEYANGLSRAEVIPPYLTDWAQIVEKQAETSLQGYQLEKENLENSLGTLINDTAEARAPVEAELPETLPDFRPAADSGQSSADVRLLESKREEARTLERVTGAISKPNVFALGNVQFIREGLPIILPPWSVGIAVEWTVFDNEKKSRNLAAKSLTEETDLLVRQKQETVDTALRNAVNTLQSLRTQTQTLDAARKQAETTTGMVRLRMENGLSSVKDVDDALRLQLESEKLYNLSVAAYHTALATYFYLQGNPEQITQYIP